MSNRPTDEHTEQVVAEWYKSECPPDNTDTDFYNNFWIDNGTVFASTRDHPETKDGYCLDPRDDTDAALELWNYIEWNYGKRIDVHQDGGWRTSLCEDMLPISGQPFRYAIVNLAIKVMVVSNGD